MNPLMTVKEVAGILRVHPNTVYQKARSGEIPSVRTSNSRIRFVEKDINEWLERRSRSSRSVPLFDEALRTDLSLENYDKLFLKGGVRIPKDSGRVFRRKAAGIPSEAGHCTDGKAATFRAVVGKVAGMARKIAG